MTIRAKLGDVYLPATVMVKHLGAYVEGAVYLKQQGTYRLASGDGPDPVEGPSLDFSDPNNSMYLALISVGGM